MTKEIELLRHWIADGDNIVFFGGAGVSTESGIPDFRSVDGLYNQTYEYPPEVMLSHTFFERHPAEFYRFYREKLIPPIGIRPNQAHIRLSQLEREGKLKAVITQNIDGLHQAAGSKRVIELHGTIHRCYCAQCGKVFSEEYANIGLELPRCACGGIIRPDVVLYEEGLDEKNITDAVNFIRHADVLIVGGTSLAVYPAAGLLDYYRGNKLALINLGETSYDSAADLVIREKIGKVFSLV